MKVSFLTPTNQKIVLNYFDVDEFCKNICFQPENKVEFQKFSRKYRYFYPYFDFVVQHLGYIFQNPLFLSNKSLLFKNKVYYLIDDNGESYQELVQKNPTDTWQYAYLVPCTNQNLNIKMATIFNFSDGIIDSNRVSMMERLGANTKDGSHTITANTVLNQLLCFDEELCRHVETINKDNIHYALRYLVDYLGFLHCDAKYKNIVGNESSLNDMLKTYVEDLKNIFDVNFLSYGKDYDKNFSDDYINHMHFRR